MLATNLDVRKCNVLKKIANKSTIHHRMNINSGFGTIKFMIPTNPSYYY